MQNEIVTSFCWRVLWINPHVLRPVASPREVQAGIAQWFPFSTGTLKSNQRPFSFHNRIYQHD